MQMSIYEELRNNGYKVTPQRLAIYNALMESHDHPTAETLFTQLQPKYPSMSLATVYKTVDMLQKIGRIKFLSTGEDSLRYDANISDHNHIQCTKCGKIMDISEGADKSTISKLEEKTGFAIQEQRLYLYGLCSKCQHEKF